MSSPDGQDPTARFLNTVCTTSNFKNRVLGVRTVCYVQSTPHCDSVGPLGGGGGKIFEAVAVLMPQHPMAPVLIRHPA